MARISRSRDLQRNAAFFLGAFGTTLGAFGGALSGLGILAWLAPDFAATAPDWFFTLVVVGLLVVLVGAWPALDWLLNSRPTVGGPVLAILGLVFVAEGLVAVMYTAWGLTGWLAIAGGVLLLPAAQLALAGGGTEPLTWRSLRTARVRSLEARADLAVTAVYMLVNVAFLIVLVRAVLDGADWATLAGLAGVGLSGFGWLTMRQYRG